MSKSLTSGRIDQRVMERITAAAALHVAARFGIGADEVARACASSNKTDGFVAQSVRNHCTEADREKISP